MPGRRSCEYYRADVKVSMPTEDLVSPPAASARLVTLEVVILAAGLGTRLGRPRPKPLVPLSCGQSIIRRQIDQLRQHFGDDLRITVVVGFKMGRVIRANPDVSFVYNPVYDSTNTSKSLLRALTVTGRTPILWLNGDVVFDPRLLAAVHDAVGEGRSLVCVNTSPVGDEEVKYTLGPDGCIAALSKTVLDPLGEAVGINYVNAADKQVLRDRLAECDAQDYFERAIELAIAKNGTKFSPLDISAYPCVEVDVQDDHDRANSLGAGR